MDWLRSNCLSISDYASLLLAADLAVDKSVDTIVVLDRVVDSLVDALANLVADTLADNFQSDCVQPGRRDDRNHNHRSRVASHCLSEASSGLHRLMGWPEVEAWLPSSQVATKNREFHPAVYRLAAFVEAVVKGERVPLFRFHLAGLD